MGIGKRIKEARETLGLTQNELAEMVGVTGSSITNYEKETSHPKEPIMYRLFEALNVDANYLFQDVVNIPKKVNDVTFAEFEHIKEYRNLDEHGKSMVDFALKEETRRIQHEAEKPRRRELREIYYFRDPVSAGKGQLVLGDIRDLETVHIPNIHKYRDVKYALPVRGDSMEPAFFNGNTLLVEATNTIDQGEIGIFVINGEAFAKKLGDNELISLNPKYDPIPVAEETYCLGRVIDKYPSDNKQTEGTKTSDEEALASSIKMMEMMEKKREKERKNNAVS